MDLDFIIESTEMLDEFDSHIKKISEIDAPLNDDSVYIRSIFRIVHNLKGSSSFFQLEDFTRDLHLFEDFLSRTEFKVMTGIDIENFCSYCFTFSDYCRDIVNGKENKDFRVIKSLDDLSPTRAYTDVVLVEDDIDQLNLYKLILEDLSFSYKTFSCPKEALAFIKNNPPSLIISDYLMPKIDGLELYKRVRDAKVNSVFIFLTGLDDKSIFRNLNDTGAFSVLSKPISRSHFIFQVNRAMIYTKEKNISFRSIKCLMSHYEALKSFYEASNKSFMLESLHKEVNEILKDHGECLVD